MILGFLESLAALFMLSFGIVELPCFLCGMSSLKARSLSLSACWDDVKSHAGALALTYLLAIALGGAAIIVFFVLNFMFTAIGGGPYSDVGPILGLFFGSIGALPVYILVCLVGILFYAIPALYFESGEVITFANAFDVLKGNVVRYILAGFFFVVVTSIGLAICFLPGIAVALTMPVYVNQIFNTNKSIFEAFSSSFSFVFKGQGWSFIGTQVLAMFVLQVVSFCTCGFGGLVALPVFCFYLQNAAYNKGLVS